MIGTKYIVILADGMADFPIPQFGGKTPLEFADTPGMDALATHGQVGLVQNVPCSMKPGSDVANLSVLGYDPLQRYTGRSPFEALSLGVPMEPSDVVYRCNLVTLSEEEPFELKHILDHSAGEIDPQDATILMKAVKDALTRDGFRFYIGSGFRNIAVWNGGTVLNLEPPHDHLGSVIQNVLPHNQMLRTMMEKSFQILNQHPINVERARKGKLKANAIWFWGAGTVPALPSFEEKRGLRGAMISAVDLLKGIAISSKMDVIQVPGADGSLETNYRGKADAAFKALTEQNYDFAFIHIEAPDEMGHQGSALKKVQAIESIDREIVSYLCSKFDAKGALYRMLVLPDHPTPVSLRTHTSDPVPYVLFDSYHRDYGNGAKAFSEREANLTGQFEPEGYKLIERLTR